jgi:hypothetical protein
MEASAKTPVHLWIVGIISMLWNAFGAFDYTMTQLRSPIVMSQMTPEQIAWIENAPMITHASWAFGVWGALLGSLLLLARSRYAIWSFVLSLAGLAVNTYMQMMKPMPAGPHMDSTADLALHAAIWAVAIALLLYALAMRRKGVLR